MSDRIELSVEGMSCQGCVRSVRAILAKTLGIDREAVEVTLDPPRAYFPDEHTDEARIEEALERLGAQGFSSARR